MIHSERPVREDRSLIFNPLNTLKKPNPNQKQTKSKPNPNQTRTFTRARGNILFKEEYILSQIYILWNIKY